MISRKQLFFTTALLVLTTTQIAVSQVMLPSRGSKNLISLNGLWKFKYFATSAIGSDSSFYEPGTDVSRWADIRTPGSWELQGFAEPFYGRNLKEGTGLYRTTFIVPATWRSQPVYLAFDGVQYGYQLWVNGRYAGSFASSYNRQTFDISGFIQPGAKATLAVRVSTRSKGWEFDTNDCWALSGIIRDVNLFSLPATHIKDVVVKTFTGRSEATVSVAALVEKMLGEGFAAGAEVSARLLDPAGKLVKEILLSKASTGPAADTVTYAQEMKISAPSLWTAETPNLYTLSVILKGNNREMQRHTEKIGIREVSWANGILKLNGAPVKLRGVDHHDLSPVNGRSLTEAEMLKDLKLMREANINFIRTSHYPSHPRFIELCDSLGFYVMEEVPYGFGDDRLNDLSYLPILKDRARATIWRDKNRPSVIVWSVGNENPITPIGLQTGRYVKQLDNTRPYCFPQVGSYFGRQADTFPDSIDILAPHYTTPGTLRGYANRFNRPMIVTEYAHSLGLDFDRMEAIWEVMYANPKLAGGAVWHFFDQGILRKSPEKIVPGAFTMAVWTDSVTMYDNHGNEGADGIVYANRVPQVDYWQVRKVYTPVKVMDDTMKVSPGKQTVRLKLINRYDFTDLSQVSARWTFYGGATPLETGVLYMYCAPHDTLSTAVTLTVPANPSAIYYYLKMEFKDKRGYTFYEKTVPLQIQNYLPDLRKSLAGKIAKPVLTAGTVKFGNYSLGLNPQTGMVRLMDASGSPLIVEGPYARMSRKQTMSELATNANAAPGSSPVWTPHLLTSPAVKIESSTAAKMVVNYNYERQNIKGQFVGGTVDYTVSDSGYINVKYRFVPDNAKGTALEAGLSFLLPAGFTQFRWVGKGPYPAYPGKNRLDEFGIFHLSSGDLNYQGNREDVALAVFSDAKGKGFAIIADNANLAVENSPRGVVVSHNAYVSGRFNKGSAPEKQIRIENLKEISGNFSIVPLSAAWPGLLQKLFGAPSKLAVPFKPFYYSYDQ